jgi:PhnB protein
MAIRLDPYLAFKDNAREAMEFYKSIFGGKLDLQTFKDFGMPTQDPATGDLVMHSMLEADNGISFMASDTPPEMAEFKEGSRVSLSLSGPDEDELRGYWDKLSEGGKVTAPLEKAPWGDIFGMVTDKFGIHWMVDIGEPRK